MKTFVSQGHNVHTGPNLNKSSLTRREEEKMFIFKFEHFNLQYLDIALKGKML